MQHTDRLKSIINWCTMKLEGLHKGLFLPHFNHMFTRKSHWETGLSGLFSPPPHVSKLPRLTSATNRRCRLPTENQPFTPRRRYPPPNLPAGFFKLLLFPFSPFCFASFSKSFFSLNKKLTTSSLEVVYLRTFLMPEGKSKFKIRSSGK